MKKLPLPRKKIDEVLFNAFQAIFLFERAKIKTFGLSFEEIYTLQLLKKSSPVRMRTLVEKINIPFSSATRMITRLEKLGYLKRIMHKHDRRGINVILEKDGEKINKSIENNNFNIVFNNISQFNDFQIAAFIETAKCMGKLLYSTTNGKDDKSLPHKQKIKQGAKKTK
jgi:DNA-binding MarR family transcriptional regulator